MKIHFLFSLLLICAFAQAESPNVAVTHTTSSNVNTTFECQVSPTGHCYYLIINSLCGEEILTTGQKQKTCRYSKFLEFSLVPGEKKLVTNLAADFQYCMKPDAMPALATCITSPNAK